MEWCLRRKPPTAMKYDVEELTRDVMARLGESVRPRNPLGESSGLDSGVPWPEDVVALRVRSMLAEVGGRLIRDAPVDLSGGGVGVSSGSGVVRRLMPCGLYASELRLPGGFLRLVTARMSGWERGVSEVSAPGSPGWGCQWSLEEGIAGCPSRPRAYLDGDGEGAVLRLVGSVSETDALEYVSVWCVPAVDVSGKFDFPESLYGDLVERLSAGLL